jgi:hypothetical protein
MSILGNGGGVGIAISGTGGSPGATITATSGNANAVTFTAVGTGHGLQLFGGATGSGLRAEGGATSGDGFSIAAVAGDGISITASGNSIVSAQDADFANIGLHDNCELNATGLDAIPITAPSGPATDFREMQVQVWRRFFKKHFKDSAAGDIITYADDGTTVITTQAYTVSGSDETVDAAT